MSRKNLLIAVLILIVIVAGSLAWYFTPRPKKLERKVVKATALEKGEKNFSKGAFKDALSDLQRAALEDPKSFKAHYLLAKSYEALSQLDKAFAEYRRAAEIDSSNAEVHYHLALLYKEKRDTPRAVAELEKSIQISPNFIGARSMLAKYYEEQGEVAKAIEQIKKIIELKPFGFDLAGAHNELGLLYIKQGKKQDAIKEWQATLAIDPENQRAKELLTEYK